MSSLVSPRVADKRGEGRTVLTAGEDAVFVEGLGNQQVAIPTQQLRHLPILKGTEKSHHV